jgi:hypothetical protein
MDAGCLVAEESMTDMSDQKTVCLSRISDAYWKVTLDVPPLNIFGPSQIPEFERIVSLLEVDPRVKVVVFESAVDGFFLTHYDFLPAQKIPRNFLRVRPVCRPCQTCWLGSVERRWFHCINPWPCYRGWKRTCSG